MKLLVCISLCALVVASLISAVKAVDIRGRGQATIMEFGNSTISSLDKRGGRGTWYATQWVFYFI
jgi:hypothetical protein